MPYADPILRKSYAKAYRERYKNKLRINSKVWRTFNADALKLKKREDYLANKSTYVKRASANFKAMPYWKQRYSRAIRKARSKGATVGDTKSIGEFYKQVYTQTAAICDYCRNVFPIRKIVIDHKQPYALGGSHRVENLCVSCNPCNHKKRAKPYDKWMAEIEGSL